MASVRKLLRRTFVHTPLRWVERAWRRTGSGPVAPPLFILGLPRSGTTLVYQYIVHRLDVAYFTNGVGTFPKSPCTVTWWQHRHGGDYRSDFKSSYGQAEGAVAPHEAGDVWARWFGYDGYVRFDDLPASAVAALREMVATVERLYGGAPFVNKNVKHLLRLDALQKIFPSALFLVVRRELPDVGLSVLRARTANGGDPQRWWSVKPANYEELKTLPPAAQVAQQLGALEQRLAEDLQAIPAERVRTLDYRDFCENPEKLIESLRQFWKGIALRNSSVDHFEITVNQPRTSAEKELITLLAQPGLCSR